MHLEALREANLAALDAICTERRANLDAMAVAVAAGQDRWPYLRVANDLTKRFNALTNERYELTMALLNR